MVGLLELGRDVVSRLPQHKRIFTIYHTCRVALGVSIYKPLLLRHRVIFIHVPKTGGQSVAQALFGFPLYTEHCRLIEYEKESPENARSFYKFTFVRNPYTRLLSAYHYLLSYSDWPKDIKFRRRILSQYRDFEDFIVNGLRQNGAIGSYLHFLPQTHYLKNSAGAIGVDFIGKFENFEEDFDAVRRHLGFGDPLPWLNRSRPLGPGFRDHFSDRAAAIVAEFYKEDIETFGYDAL